MVSGDDWLSEDPLLPSLFSFQLVWLRLYPGIGCLGFHYCHHCSLPVCLDCASGCEECLEVTCNECPSALPANRIHTYIPAAVGADFLFVNAARMSRVCYASVHASRNIFARIAKTSTLTSRFDATIAQRQHVCAHARSIQTRTCGSGHPLEIAPSSAIKATERME